MEINKMSEDKMISEGHVVRLKHFALNNGEVMTNGIEIWRNYQRFMDVLLRNLLFLLE